MIARIALRRQDANAFERHLTVCQNIYCAYRHPALVAKIERLRQQSVTSQSSAATLVGLPDVPSVAHIMAALARCEEPEQCARLALTFIARHAGTTDAFLFDISGTSVQYATQVGDGIVTGELMHTAQLFLDQRLMAADTTASDAREIAAVPLGASGSEISGPIYTPLVISHREGAITKLTGFVLLARPARLDRGRMAPMLSEISRHRAERGWQAVPVPD